MKTEKKVTITIKKDQAEFIKDNSINLSRFVQNAINVYRKETRNTQTWQKKNIEVNHG